MYGSSFSLRSDFDFSFFAFFCAVVIFILMRSLSFRTKGSRPSLPFNMEEGMFHCTHHSRLMQSSQLFNFFFCIFSLECPPLDVERTLFKLTDFYWRFWVSIVLSVFVFRSVYLVIDIEKDSLLNASLEQKKYVYVSIECHFAHSNTR